MLDNTLHLPLQQTARDTHRQLDHFSRATFNWPPLDLETDTYFYAESDTLPSDHGLQLDI